jgi:RNA polymerase sigma-70 factor (ECF subfamily)
MMPAPSGQSPPPDAELLSKIAGGDLHALGVLFDRYEATVKRYIGRLSVPAAEVDDLVQLTFLDVPGAAARFDARCSFKSWLLGLASIVVRRHRRSAFRMAARLRAWASDPSSLPSSVPVEAFEQREAAARAMQALEKLSYRKREVFVMMVLENVSGEDAARALGIPVATVWTRMHHARRDLRHLLRERVR